MTDFSKVADALIELINSKPASPRKDEIVAVLQAHLGEQWEGPGVEPVADPNVVYWTTGVNWADLIGTPRVLAHSGAATPYLTSTSTSGIDSAAADLSEASLEAAIQAISSYRSETDLINHIAGPGQCSAHTDGVHRMGPTYYNVLMDADVSDCACGYKVVLQK